ncbi:MAG: energy transducer TonB [Chitinophagales bacterium]|nr:energy transducer TonB [Chitinophagales bacterium]
MRLIVFLLVIFMSHFAYSQGNTGSVISQAEYSLTPPSFLGGNLAKKSFLSSHIQYPKEALMNKVEGVVELKMIVETDGSLSGIKIIKDPGGGLGEEALRVYLLMPNWQPGILYGQPVRVPITETINFKLVRTQEPKDKKIEPDHNRVKRTRL